MKEKIYTIPVTEAFGQDCECPVCLLEEKLDNEYTDYYLGPALMEPDCRIETNKKGFCRRHFEMLYNRQENRLGLALETDTHMREILEKLKALSSAAKTRDNGAPKQFLGAISGRLWAKSHENAAFAAELSGMLANLEGSCAICDKLNRTMDRYMEVIMHLWLHEEDFRKLFESRKGFCMVHFGKLVEASAKYLSPVNGGIFVRLLLEQQMEHLERIEKELDWFTKKFDYRNNDAPWGNSRDALPRSIRKLKGYCDLK